MQMTEELDKLKRLQDILAEKYDIEAKVEELPKSLVGTTETHDSFKKEYIEKNEQYESKKAQVAQLKSELEEAQRKREEGEKAMDGISTHREYEILDKQIKEAQDLEDSKRKELQHEEKNLAELQDTLKSLEETISSMEQDINESKANMDKEYESFNSKLQELKAQEDAECEGIDPETIMKFQRIIRRNRKGIVSVKGNVCDGCHMVLPAQFANEVQRGEKILFCPYCSRILFYEESTDSNFYSLESSVNAADSDDDLFRDEDDDLIDMSDDSIDEEDSKSMDFENQYIQDTVIASGM